VGDFKTNEIRRAVRATELNEKLSAPIVTLSRGYKQRVGVAQAILGKPRVLILDEPTNGLDPTQTEHMRNLIREIAKEATVMLSTHIMQEVDALCDRVVIVNAGQLVVDATLQSLKQEQALELCTTLAGTALQQVVRNLSGISDCRELGSAGEWRNYRLQFSGDAHGIAAALASAVLGAGGQLASLQRVSRSLETLFREVSSGHATASTSEVQPHAA
jgi:ABC-2 type transport system ATP-binding protein